MKDLIPRWTVNGGEKEVPDEKQLMLRRCAKDLPMQCTPQQINIKWHCFI